MAYAIRPADNDEAPQEVEMIDQEGEVVARGYIRADLVSDPIPGTDVRCGLTFVGMGIER